MLPPGLCDGAQLTPSPAPAAFLYPHSDVHIPAGFVQKNYSYISYFSLSFFWGGAGVYRDPEEAAAVMETAGAETLSVLPSEIPPGAVRLSAAEEVRGISGGEGWMQRPEQEHSKWEHPPRGRDGFCWVQSCV